MPLSTSIDMPLVDLQEPMHDALDISFPNPALNLFFPEENQRMEEIVQASNILFGSIETQELKSIETGIGMPVGRGEEISLLEEDSIHNRTGFIGIGVDDTFSGTVPLVMDHQEFAQVFNLDNNTKISISDIGTSLTPLESKTLFNGNFLDAQSETNSSSFGAIASTENFTLEVEYAPIQDEHGYFFCIKLLPKSGVVFKRIRQNLFFLIDRSHSIASDRFDATKRAVLQALPLLSQEDTFNILVFDTKIVRMSEVNLPFNRSSLEQAEIFLSSQKYGGIFASTDLYSSLGDIVPDAVAGTEVNTAILLSDGDTYLRKDNQRETIGKWTKHNSGKVSLFSVAAGKGNNLPLLDVLSSLNKGALHSRRNIAVLKKLCIS